MVIPISLIPLGSAMKWWNIVGWFGWFGLAGGTWMLWNTVPTGEEGPDRDSRKDPLGEAEPAASGELAMQLAVGDCVSNGNRETGR